MKHKEAESGRQARGRLPATPEKNEDFEALGSVLCVCWHFGFLLSLEITVANMMWRFN